LARWSCRGRRETGFSSAWLDLAQLDLAPLQSALAKPAQRALELTEDRANR
jgi:hypothetical protein